MLVKKSFREYFFPFEEKERNFSKMRIGATTLVRRAIVPFGRHWVLMGAELC